jgi:hypothetical protein
MNNLNAILELIGDTLLAIETIIHDFTKVGNEYIAFKLLTTIYEAMEYILQATASSDIYLENKNIKMSFDNIILQLSNLLKCMENEDYILLCDILEFEIYSNLQIIHSEIKEA